VSSSQLQLFDTVIDAVGRLCFVLTLCSAYHVTDV